MTFRGYPSFRAFAEKLAEETVKAMNQEPLAKESKAKSGWKKYIIRYGTTKNPQLEDYCFTALSFGDAEKKAIALMEIHKGSITDANLLDEKERFLQWIAPWAWDDGRYTLDGTRVA